MHRGQTRAVVRIAVQPLVNVNPSSSRPYLAALIGLVVVLVVALGASPSLAATPKNCGKLVVADWFGDGRVDKIFPLHCYDDAIRTLPVDVITYSNAKEDILRALAYAKKGKPDPGDGSTSTTGSGSGGSTTPTTLGNDGGETGVIGPDTDTSGPSSIPVPLLVLGGLAIVLLAAGGAGYLNRRRHAGDDDPDATP